MTVKGHARLSIAQSSRCKAAAPKHSTAPSSVVTLDKAAFSTPQRAVPLQHPPAHASPAPGPPPLPQARAGQPLLSRPPRQLWAAGQQVHLGCRQAVLLQRVLLLPWVCAIAAAAAAGGAAEQLSGGCGSTLLSTRKLWVQLFRALIPGTHLAAALVLPLRRRRMLSYTRWSLRDTLGVMRPSAASKWCAYTRGGPPARAPSAPTVAAEVAGSAPIASMVSCTLTSGGEQGMWVKP